MLSDLSEFVLNSHYSQVDQDPTNGQTLETWEQSVKRVMDMHRCKYKDYDVATEIDEVEAFMLDKRLLGSQRALQFGGTPILEKNARMYNCCATYLNRPRAFQEIMWTLLCGTGAGFSVQKHHIAQLPCIQQIPVNAEQVIVIVEDSIEGWADAAGKLLSTYFTQQQPFPEFFGKLIHFDLSYIRPKGAPIRNINGKAPGSEPLRIALEKIKNCILYPASQRCPARTQLTPLECYDIIMILANAVVSGGVRRSATISLFSEDDNEMMTAKTGNWFIEHPERGRSNNSVVLLKKDLTREKLATAIQRVKEFGEPGIVLSDSYEALFNPCVPEDTWILTSKGLIQVKDLINTPFEALVHGVAYPSHTGFVFTGVKQVYKLTTKDGLTIQATKDHKIMNGNGNWIPLGNFQINDKIAIHDHQVEEGKHLCDTIAKITEGPIVNVYDATVEEIHAFVANGIILHNCVEIGLYGYNEQGHSGFEMCNLCEINMKKVTNNKDFLAVCRAASILGTLQAGYTDFAYLGAVTESIVRKEALLGVSMTGLCDNPDLAFDAKLQRAGASVVKEINREFAPRLGINISARTTAVKPAGSTSCLLETASGIHPHHSQYYFRRVQANKTDPALQFFKKINPRAVRHSQWSTSGRDDVITFCCKVGDSVLTKQKIDAVQLLSMVKLTQDNWILTGKNPELCVKPWLSHNVSNTIQVASDQWDYVIDFILQHKESFAGLSFLPQSGDLDYPQAPFQAILFEDELVKKYGRGTVFASGLIMHALNEFNNLYDACRFLLTEAKLDEDMTNVNSATQSIAELQEQVGKKIWSKRAKQFAERYFLGNLQEMTYCLKSIDALKHWSDLEREYVKPDWNQYRTEFTHTLPQRCISQLPIACSGGTCELIKL